MSNIDLAPIHAFLDHTTPKDRSNLLPALHAAQDEYGYIPEIAAAEIAKALSVPLADVFGVIDFYSLLYSRPVGKTVVHVCKDPACMMAGADTVLKMLSSQLTYFDDAREKPLYTIEIAPCLGLCEQAPAILVDGIAAKADQTFSISKLFSEPKRYLNTTVDGDVRFLTKNCGLGESVNLNRYLQNGGYSALKKALQLTPAEVVEQVKLSGLVGRGGAAFPTGVKWEGAIASPEKVKFVVCNGDEAEPGTFKDRILMEDDPHQIIEGMIICAYAIGAEKGYFYIRAEYQNAANQVKAALDDCRNSGFLGDSIMDSDFNFDIELRRGAGAYICGEETALFESIEGKRGFPRIKPPFPTQAGLFGKPTVINNVETLANVALIFNLGIEAYRALGTEKSPGTKLFCLSGDISRPGLYEVPFGVTLGHIIEDLAGGMREEIPFLAALIGGAAGAIASPEELDTKLSFEDLRRAGLPLGSGVITVFNQNRDLRAILFKLASFFAEESCGKCYPCQIGTQRQLEIMERVNAGNPDDRDERRLSDLIETMTDSSLCGLGQTAGSAIKSAMIKWPHLFSPSATISTSQVGGPHD